MNVDLQPFVRHLDLFSGIGGFALAAQMVGGIETIGFSEIEPYACRVLAKNFPNVKNYGDIHNLTGIRADIVTGGYPCQPFSSAGQRKGSSDDRHLWPEARRVIEDSGATWVLCENVAGHVSLGLDDVLFDLEGIGYACQPIIVPACAVGAQHRRDRVWILAHAMRGRETVGRDRPGGGRLAEQATRHRMGEVEMESCFCRDFDGVSAPMDRLRGLGNAIVPQVAAEILRAMMSVDSLTNGKDHTS